MRNACRRRPSAALVIACLALFVALGGVGYAATKINGQSIVKGTVTAKQIKDRSLGSKELSNGSNVGGGVGFIGDCSTVAGVDQACASSNDDADAGAVPRAFFVVFN